MSMTISVAILSCLLAGSPDSSPVPEGSLPMMNLPISDELAASLGGRIAPAQSFTFAGDEQAAQEWVVPIGLTADGDLQVIRLTYNMLNYRARIGLVEQNEAGSQSFEEQVQGICTVKESASQSGEPMQ